MSNELLSTRILRFLISPTGTDGWDRGYEYARDIANAVGSPTRSVVQALNLLRAKGHVDASKTLGGPYIYHITLKGMQHVEVK